MLRRGRYTSLDSSFQICLKMKKDEMNLHVPQNIEAEIDVMVNSRFAIHIVSPQRNAPINGPVQDALIASMMISMIWEDESVIMVERETALRLYQEAEIPEDRVKDLIYRAQKYYPQFINDGQFTEEIPGSLFISILFPYNFCYKKKIDDPIVASRPIV